MGYNIECSGEHVTKDRKPRTSAKTAKTKSTKAATSAAKRSARPTKPAAKKLAKPGAKKPAKPAAKKPTKPAAKKPTKPAAKKPAKPVAKKPAKPGAKKLAKKPTKPAAKKPAKPAAKKLAKKPAKKPAKPAAKKPAEAPKASLSSPSSPPPPTVTPEHVHDESCSHDQGEISRRLTSDVASYGWHVVLVEADEEGPAFGYTVGAFESYGVPEVLMVGLDPEVMHSVLNEIVARMRDGARFEVGKPHPGLIERYEVVFKPVHASHYEGWLGQAIRYHEEVPFPVLQCVWPDMEGRFPWDEKATPGLSIQQPVLDELWA